MQQLSAIDWYVFVIIQCITIIAVIVGNKLRNNNKYSTLEYLVMGRQLTLPLFVATMVATWYGNIYVTQIAFNHGIYNFITQGVCWYLAYILFALYFVNKIRRYNALTLPELVGKLFGRKSALYCAFLMFFKTLPIPYAIGIGLLIQLFWPMPLFYASLLGVGLVSVYSLFGGLRAVVFSDFIQFFTMCIGVVSVIFFSVSNFGGLDFLQDNLPASYFSIKGNYSFGMVWIWVFIAFITTLLSPTFYQRCMAAKDTKTARRGIFISTFIWIIFDLCTTFGAMYAKAVIPDADPNNAYLIYSLQILPVGWRGLLIAGVFAVILSTLDSNLLVSSNILSYDLPILKNTSLRVKHFYSIIFTAILTVLLAAIFDGDIEAVWLFFKSSFAVCLVIPILVGYVWAKMRLRVKQCKFSH